MQRLDEVDVRLSATATDRPGAHLRYRRFGKSGAYEIPRCGRDVAGVTW